MFYLASQSPRRKELLTLAGLSFEVLVSGCDETVPDGFTAEQTVQHLANLKAEAVLKLCKPEDAVLAADTIVVIDGNILGKPKDKDDAFAMLRSLSGRTHTVMTGVCIASGRQRKEFVSKTDVTFYDLTDEEIDEVLSILEDTIEDPDRGMELTELNDFFWFDRDTIAEWLGYEDYDELMNR